ncbi:MAG: hypothetical protein HY353_04365, partial [Candidatus Omnitrophica bacterium]|nr:hypothetical protein [Candidatus Omnitrophota bacterium]
VVDDGTFGDMEEVPITVVAPPVLDPIGPKTINEGQLLSFSVSAMDSDAAATLTLSATNLPAGASFPTVNGTGSVSGTFNWTPGFNQAGSYQVTFTAADQGGLSDSEAITITVNNVNQAPTITTGNQDMHEKTDLTFAFNCGGSPCTFFEVVATDPDGDPVSLSMVTWPPPPPGSSFDSVSRRFTWTNPSFAALRRCHASYSATFQAADGLGGWAQKTLTITWKRCGAGSAFCASLINHPPIIFAISRSDGGWGGIDTPWGQTTGWMYNQVYAGNLFTLLSEQTLLTPDRDFYPTCDPDGDALSAYAWSYLGSSPAGVTQEQLNLNGLNQPTATGTAPTTVGTILNFRLQVQDSQGGSGSADTSVQIIQRSSCFIATAAYGNPLAPELDILRAYRDDVLARSWLGQRFIELYYRTSSPVAQFIADKPSLRALTRQALRPVIVWARRQLALAE